LPDSTPLRRGALVSFAGAKVQLFCKLPKYSASFFIKKAFFAPYTYYIIYARVKKKGRKREVEGGGRRGCDKIAPYRTEG
jgi:hypothetical protein